MLSEMTVRVCVPILECILFNPFPVDSQPYMAAQIIYLSRCPYRTKVY